MRWSRWPLWCSLALLSSTPAWSEGLGPAEKTVKGKLVSMEDNGMGHTIIVETPEGKKVLTAMDPGSSPPEGLKVGEPVVVTYAEVTETRVSAIRLASGPKFKKKPAASAQGTLVGYSSGDMADVLVLEKGGQQTNYSMDLAVLDEARFEGFKGKTVEVALYKHTALEVHELQRQP